MFQISSAVLANRFSALARRLREISSDANLQVALGDDLDPIVSGMDASFRARTPRGQVEPAITFARRLSGGGLQQISVSRGRPSLRLHGQTLESGWLPPLYQNVPGGLEVTFRNIAPHIQLVMTGSNRPGVRERVRHSIPGPVAFHLGDPLRWPPRIGQPGPRIFGRIANHPGATPNPFREVVLGIYLGPMLRAFRNAMSRALFVPLRRFFR